MNQMNIQIQIDEESRIVKSAHGEIDFTVDDDGISIFQIFVHRKLCGIGSALIERLENFCLQRNFRKITVPSTPSKEALSFWLAKGYNYVFAEDYAIGNAILNNQYQEEIVDTDSGIILLEKMIGGLL
jgi:GNAT superfamily N-acetyltransferase